MIKIAFLNQKGGVGKSTSTVNIGAALVKCLHQKVLIIDCDAQCNSSQQLRGDIEDDDITLYEHFTEGIPLEEIYEQIEVKRSPNPFISGTVQLPLYVVPSNKKLGKLTLHVSQFRASLAPLEDQFDFCLFDMPPQFGGLGALEDISADTGCSVALGALIASDYVIVPVTPQTSAISGLGDLVNSVNDIRRKGWNLDLKILGVLVNMVDERVGLDKHLVNELKKDMDLVFDTHIKRSADISYAEYEGKLVVYMRKTAASNEYITLAKEIYQRVIDMEKSKGHTLIKKRLQSCLSMDAQEEAQKENK